jgi:Aerotolerance regulator N-terminal/von Willebrand factor type A domain
VESSRSNEIALTFPIPLIAFGFGNLAMLGWLAAAAAPLLIHLWSRHRFREVDWAAIQFLLAAMRKNARRLQLQQWLLLAVRTLLVLLVVLAMAEPYGAGLVAGISASAPAHKVMVLDASYSMSYTPQAGDVPAGPTKAVSTIAGRNSNFARAKQLAAELVRNGSSADAFTLIAMSDPPRTVLGREVVDPAAVIGQIEALPLSQTPARLSAVLDLVAEAVEANAADARGHRRQEVYFFTDLQRATWAPTSPKEAKQEGPLFRERFASLVKQAALVVVDVGAPDAANLAISQFAVEDPFVTTGRDVPLTVTLRQFGTQPRTGCAVELSVDDQPVGEQTVDVPAGGETTLHFAHRFTSPGSHALAVRAAGDRLPLDDARFLAVPVKERLRVLCVAGREGAARYIAGALNPDASSDSAIEPVIVSDGDLEELDLSKFDAIFLCNVAQLTPGEAGRLSRYAAAGGGIVFFLGDRVIAEQYNQPTPNSRAPAGRSRASAAETAGRSASHEEALGLFPVRLGAVTAASKPGIDPLDYRHAIVAPFRGRERAGLLTTPIARYFKLDLPENRVDVEVAAALASGDPLIVASPFGRGRTIVVATDGSLTSVDSATGEPWTIWPTWPSFLPIVRELLAYAASGNQAQLQQLVGDTLGGTLPGSVAGLQMVRPDGRTDSIPLRSTPDGLHWSYAKTDTTGIYALRGATADEKQPVLQIAVNVDAAEGDLAKAHTDALPAEVLVRDTWRQSDRAAAAGLSPRSAWNVPLLWAALVLLFLESLLAWQFGRGAL